MPADQIRTHRFDCIMFQDDHHLGSDQYLLLTSEQRALHASTSSTITPREHPTDTPAPGRRSGRAAGARHALQRADVGQRPHAIRA
jgi:hypothetical protein